ncbi:MAG: helix-hairpin-helix domain-containing protein [Deltaproteobacteria bacterium]|nr:helix-hairpin-helix domain-containing protein [Deltaproteobacteria bacterium]
MRDDRVGASLALLLVLLGLGLAGSTDRGPADRQPSSGETHFVEAAGDVSRPGVYAFPENTVTLRDLAARAGCGSALEGRDVPERGVLSSGSKAIFSRESRGIALCRIERMDGFQCMTLGIPVSVNRASREDLTALPGVGPSLALAMVEHRQRAKGFKRGEDLLKVHGIGRGLLKRIKPHIAVP